MKMFFRSVEVKLQAIRDSLNELAKSVSLSELNDVQFQLSKLRWQISNEIFEELNLRIKAIRNLEELAQEEKSMTHKSFCENLRHHLGCEDKEYLSQLNCNPGMYFHVNSLLTTLRFIPFRLKREKLADLVSALDKAGDGLYNLAWQIERTLTLSQRSCIEMKAEVVEEIMTEVQDIVSKHRDLKHCNIPHAISQLSPLDLTGLRKVFDTYRNGDISQVEALNRPIHSLR
jgi:hypothetical protein